MISDGFCGVDTVPVISVLQDRGRQAESLGLRLAWTGCNFGGVRPWLVCPLCGARRAKLHYEPTFMRPSEAACRKCLQLGYMSKRARWVDRRLLRASRLRQRLGGVPSARRRFPPRPPGMHRRAYSRIRAQVVRLEREARVAQRVAEERALMRWETATANYLARRPRFARLAAAANRSQGARPFRSSTS